MAMSMNGPFSCIKHKTLSYIGCPTVPTELPANDAVPIFEGIEKAEAFRLAIDTNPTQFECEEFSTLPDFVFFLQMVDQQGIQYGIVNPVFGEKLPNSLFHIGRMLAQIPGGRDFPKSGT